MRGLRTTSTILDTVFAAYTKTSIVRAKIRVKSTFYFHVARLMAILGAFEGSWALLLIDSNRWWTLC